MAAPAICARAKTENRENAENIDVLKELRDHEWHTTLEEGVGELLRRAGRPDEDRVFPMGPLVTVRTKSG